MASRVIQLHIQILSVAFAGAPTHHPHALLKQFWQHQQLLSDACMLAAGALGGIVNFLIAPLFGALHITTGLGVQIAPGLDKADLYSKVVW